MLLQNETKIRIKKNDQVKVMAGREKGKIAKVLKVDLKAGRITLEKVNMVKKHVKPSQKNPQGGIIEKELPIHASNVMLYCEKCKTGVRFGVKLGSAESATKNAKKGSTKNTTSKESSVTKTRVCKRCNSTI